MTSPSRLSRESTTRSSVLPQKGHRMTGDISQLTRVDGRVFGLVPKLFPVQSLAQRQHEPRQQHRHAADDVEEDGDRDRRVDVEQVELREHELTRLMET